MSAPVVIPFSDDSTLFFAQRMRALLRDVPNAPPVALWHYLPEDALSMRQFKAILPQGPDRRAVEEDLAGLFLRDDIAGVVTNRLYRPLSDALQDPSLRARAGRPRVVAFEGGLEFFPKRAYLRRRFADSVFLVPRGAAEDFETVMETSNLKTRPGVLGFGHPAFLHPGAALSTQRGDPGGDIWFFAQALSPSTRRGRLHIVKVLAALARRHPERSVWIKLRHLPDENQRHLHRERYDYPSLMARLPDPPPNLRTIVCAMDEALARTGIGITCTSTAAADLVSNGRPCMIHLDTVDCYRDPLVAPMRRLFGASGLIAPLADVLSLSVQPPDPDWARDFFCPPDLGERVLAQLAARP
ncbi:DUF6716 putative glycosyltransferase [Poseidonocella sedimentorum]|uniref:Uncharacterized protein n=1 Tax=Poseidonocella sedimentorum TaxID=871652 RepID=A0A1I6EDM9_9RHOB|nr:DUF6716 putative glycosyltransferase [Poseidonocella sedimentorum]SFR15631.1 hypothetical protein SAMN04515673_11025 [Poseidonocella sedimentorum]